MIIWAEIKDASLRKMFAITGLDIKIDSNTREYIYAMPQACNEALQMLATVGKFLKGKKTFIIQPVNNLLKDTEQDFELDDSELEFSAEGAKSYYFRATKGVKVSVYVDDAITTVIECTDESYAAYKGLIENPDKKEVKLVFQCDYPAHITSITLYSSSYETENDIPVNEKVIRYDLKKVLPDFYQIYEVYCEKDGKPRYLATSEYNVEADDTIVFYADKPGVYTVYYKKYAEPITQATEDEYELPLDQEVAAIIPLYIASQLYKDDDNGIATTYRNEFETAFDRLKQSVEIPRREEFIGESGWI
jgi:hypothetical protein